jgi:hypothetical protein
VPRAPRIPLGASERQLCRVKNMLEIIY